MSNGEEKRTERTNPAGELAARTVQQSDDQTRPTSPANPTTPEIALPQKDSKMSNGEEKWTERTNPTGELAARTVQQSGNPAAPENTPPQADSKTRPI